MSCIQSLKASNTLAETVYKQLSSIFYPSQLPGFDLLISSSYITEVLGYTRIQYHFWDLIIHYIHSESFKYSHSACPGWEAAVSAS